MKPLHNRVSQKELKEALYKESIPRYTISFYKYSPISDPKAFRDMLFSSLSEWSIFGRIYVAHEGINAQISVPHNQYDHFKNFLFNIPGFEGIRLNMAVDDDGKSFWVLKIKVREKIVADGINDPGFSMEQTGEYLDAESFNSLADEENTIIVDMRNHYEYEVGHFKNAMEIPSDTFREQLPMAVEMLKEKKDKKIIMYCTGGIRCEKASAYMKHHGFNDVYHIEGGIIQYVNVVKEKKLENKFIGKNFVFDERLGERITTDIISHCHQCNNLSDRHTNCANEACHLLFIQCDSCSQQMNGCCSETCMKINLLPEEERNALRKGIDKGKMIFNKSKDGKLRPRLNPPQ